MISNTKITLYHKGYDYVNRVETWTRFIYTGWWFGGKGASINKGYDNANDVNVRLWYGLNENLNINNIAVGDILVPGEQPEISSQQDLNGLDVYNITSITNNMYGSVPHVHLGGK